jgi:hypothetical protein
MAQETVPPAQTKTTVKITRMYRSTEAGGFDKTYVLLPDGALIRPSHRVRSRSGNHGWDEWYLGVGKYVVVSISRPNLRNGAKPYTINVQCIDTTAGNVIAERKFYVMDWSLEDVRNWARGICP